MHSQGGGSRGQTQGSNVEEKDLILKAISVPSPSVLLIEYLVPCRSNILRLVSLCFVSSSSCRCITEVTSLLNIVVKTTDRQDPPDSPVLARTSWRGIRRCGVTGNSKPPSNNITLRAGFQPALTPWFLASWLVFPTALHSVLSVTLPRALAHHRPGTFEHTSCEGISATVPVRQSRRTTI